MEAETFSLYLDLAEGGTADLEIVARASLSLAAAIREAAYIIDPSLEVRLELESGTEGSLTLNTIFRCIKTLTPNRETVKALTFVAICWFANDVRQYGVAAVLDRLFHSDTTLSDQQKDEIRKIVSDAIGKNVAGGKVQTIYQELERDETIRGVGATNVKNRRPDSIVPRERFSERSASTIIVESIAETRTVTTVQTVTLVSPVLIHSERGWRFYAGGVEFTAKIADKSFVDDALSGRTNIPLKEGIHMIVELTSDEVKEDGVWVIKKRTIKRVIGIHGIPKQASLDLFPRSD